MPKLILDTDMKVEELDDSRFSTNSDLDISDLDKSIDK